MKKTRKSPRKRERIIQLVKRFNYDPMDVGVAAYHVIASRYGDKSIENREIMMPFGLMEQPTAFVKVKTGPNEESICLASSFRIATENFKAEIGVDRSALALGITDKYRAEAEMLFALVEERLVAHSIYKGKALTSDRQFLDLKDVSIDNLVFDEDTLSDINTHLWGLIEKMGKCVKLGIPLQRKILLEGPYGSGKTILGLVTAKKAIDHGWTFVYVPPTIPKDDDAVADMFGSSGKSRPHPIIKAIKFIRGKYEPGVIFFEDVDYEQRADDQGRLNQLLSQADGLLSKNSQLILVMTTNRFKQVKGAMLRPGRTDRVIRVGAMQDNEIKRLITMTIPVGMLDENIAWEVVATACNEYTPAFVKEVAMGALLRAVIYSDENPKVTQSTLEREAACLREQHNRCKEDSTGQYL